MTLGERISRRMAEMGLSQAELARRVGITQPSINHLIKRGAAGSSHLHKIAQELQTTPAYLAGETDDPAAGYIAPPAPAVVAAELGLVPVRELDLSLGMGGAFLDAPVTERVQHFPRDWLRNFTHSPPEDLFFAIAVGDSMIPTMVSGDIVLIDRRQNVVDHADLIWAFSFGGMGMIKRLGPGRDGQIKIQSDNPAVRTDFAAPDELHIMGRIVAVVRKM